MDNTKQSVRTCPLCGGSGRLECVDGWGNTITRKCRRCHGAGVIQFSPVRALWTVVTLVSIAIVIAATASCVQ